MGPKDFAIVYLDIFCFPILTHFCIMDFPTLISRVSPVPILGVLGGIFIQNFKRKLCLQTGSFFAFYFSFLFTIFMIQFLIDSCINYSQYDIHF